MFLFFGGGGGFGHGVEVAGAEDEIGGEREVVDPVGVAVEGVDEFAVFAVPDLDGFVL